MPTTKNGPVPPRQVPGRSLMPSVELRMPSPGPFERMLLTTWLVDQHATVRLDQPVLSMETTKASVDLCSPATGTLERLAAEGTEIGPGDLLGRIQSSD